MRPAIGDGGDLTLEGVGLLVLLVWSYPTGMWLRSRLWRWVVRHAREGTLRAALLWAGAQLSGLLAFVAACFAYYALGEGAYAAVGSTFVVVLVGLVYSPLAMAAMPSRSGLADLRRDLQAAGATSEQAQAAAWAGGIPATFGLVIIVTTWVTIA